MAKSPDAFRTISEVAKWAGTQTHVLRFWESKFTAVDPVKRKGGRRYYRPDDMRLIGGIKKLLHDDGMTIKGVQKLIADEGVDFIRGYSPKLDFELQQDATRNDPPEKPKAPTPLAEISTAPNVVAFTMKPLPMRKKPEETAPLNTEFHDDDQPLLFPEMAEWNAPPPKNEVAALPKVTGSSSAPVEETSKAIAFGVDLPKDDEPVDSFTGAPGLYSIFKTIGTQPPAAIRRQLSDLAARLSS